MGRGRGVDHTGRSKRSEPFVKLPVWIMETDEYRGMGCVAQAMLVQLIRRHRHPSHSRPGNNGRIAAGDRALAGDMGVSKNTVTRAKQALLSSGLVEVGAPAVYERARKLATEYRLAWLSCDRTGALPSFKPEGRARAPP